MRKVYFLSALFFLLLLLAPTILSTPLGKPFFEKALRAKSGAEVTIGSLELSWLGPQKFGEIAWKKGEVHGTVGELEVKAPFWSFSGPTSWAQGSALYQGGKIDQVQGSYEEPHFKLQGNVEGGNLFAEGDFHAETDYNFRFDLKQFPVGILDLRLPKILGTTADLVGSAHLQGEEGGLQLDVRSENLTTQLQALMIPGGMTLRTPWTLEIRSTPALSDFLLQDVNPLFLKQVEPQGPIRISFEPQDSYLPIPFSLDKFSAKGTLDLGQVQCRNGKSLAAVMSFLKMKELSHVKKMNVWFTPLPFFVHEGTLHAGRVDLLLADSVHLCTWGTVDLHRDQIQMTLGIPADTLHKSFGVKNLPSNYVLKVEVRGPIQDPEIVTGPAIAKIATLMTVSQVPKKGVLGGVAEVFSHPKEEKDVPPPQRPFPWER